MRRYRITLWIILILSIIDFTLAVPVSVRDIHGVRVNVVGEAVDRIAALEKRMDNDGGESDLDDAGGGSEGGSSESDLHVGGGERLSDDDGGEWASDVTSEHERPYNGRPESGPESESESEYEIEIETESESGSDPDGDDGGENGGEAVEEVEPENNENQVDQHQPDEEHQGSDDEAHDQEQSPPHSPELQHPAASTYEDLWSKLLKDSLRPRTSTSGVAT